MTRLYATYGDDILYGLARQNDAEAFAAIYRRYLPVLVDMACRKLQDREECRDIVQNVFTDLWRRKRQLEIGNLAAYLFTAVRYQVRRSVFRQPGMPPQPAVHRSIPADAAMLEKELWRMAKRWISALPEKRQKIFLMHYDEELPTKEIAASLSISRKTVQNQLNTACAYIRERLHQNASRR